MINDITKDISVIYDRIISKLTNYINNSNNNQKLVLEVLKSIDNFIRTKLPKENITLNNIIIRDKISSLKEPQILFPDCNEENNYCHDKNLYESLIKEPEPISSKQYFIIKLKRKIKEQHEQNKIRELGYLERICNLQKRLNILETNNLINKSKDIPNENEDKKYDFLNKSKIRVLLNSSDKKKPVSFSQEKNGGKKYNKTFSNNENQKAKQISIKIKEINIESLNNFSLLIKDLHKYISSLIYMEPDSKKNMALNWSINFLLQNSKKIEENLKDNYSFIEDTEKEINSLIDTYKYDELATCLSGFNTCQIKQELNEMSLLKLRKIDTNNIVTKIINQFPVYIKIETKEQVTKTKDNNINVKLNVDIRIAKSKEKKKIVDSKDIYVNEKHNFKIYKTIDSFTKFFDLIQDQKICQYTFDSKDNEGNSKDKKDIYDYIKNINLPERTTAFLNTTLKETVSDMLYTEKTNKTKIPSILTKINKKIIGEIYTQFKKYLPNEKDNELSLKTQSLSWTDINNFINDEYHLYDCIVSFIIKCLQKFENKKISNFK